MIEGIHQIGKMLGENLILGDKINVDTSKTYKICRIDFNTNKQKISIYIEKEFSIGDEEKFRFVKLKLSGRQNQFFVTFKDIKRLIIESDEDKGKRVYGCWISLKNELDTKSSLYPQIEKIYNIFYKNNELDFDKFNESSIKDLTSLRKYLKRTLGKDEEIIFFTISINNELLCKKDEYIALLTKKIIDSKKKLGKVTCSICGNKSNEYFDDFARMPLKFFINDKVGFSQKLSNSWEGNFVLCKKCYIYLLNGQKFILNKSLTLGNIKYIIIPEFLEDVKLGSQKFKGWFEEIKNYYNPFKVLDENSLKEKLSKYYEYNILQYFWLNYVFFEQNNQQFKIYSIIKDIPKSRIDEIKNKFMEYNTRIFKFFPFFNQFKLKNLGDIYWIIPLRFSSKDKKILELPKVLNIFSDLLENRALNRNFLIREFWIGLRAKYFNNLSYHNIVKSENTDFELTQYLLRSHQMLIFLNIIEGGNTMEDDNLEIPEAFKNYLNEVKFDNKQKSLFLLGILIADIGSKQVKYGNKPILNKINFQGMGIDKITILFNEIYEKLKQENLLNKEREIVYSVAHRIFDKERLNWNLKPHENIYYILSGYSYKTFLSINEAKTKVKNSNYQIKGV